MLRLLREFPTAISSNYIIFWYCLLKIYCSYYVTIVFFQNMSLVFCENFHTLHDNQSDTKNAIFTKLTCYSDRRVARNFKRERGQSTTESRHVNFQSSMPLKTCICLVFYFFYNTVQI